MLTVTGFYASLLNRRAPVPLEVAAWVNSELDLLTIEVFFAGSAEYFLQT